MMRVRVSYIHVADGMLGLRVSKHVKHDDRARGCSSYGRTVKMQSTKEQSEDSYYRRTMDFRRTNVVILVGIVVLIVLVLLC